ncbi:long-chain-fatty-acid--CoA ligase [Rhodococcus sp. Z13]|uniref:Long-chain-fatty-acid--CoA ligase n=1 Tax=Rhodococcus sacchari TaxID=2962047 RepID=A0ACD4DFZ5_9NOCA|nr:long-chain-fatty-acid--CoA ligase [Rhodococcus sp. Z13]UYP18865.1 long-chain-fatty-acid--CoA ligase [Rhodococcus sp. Z13]
MSELHLPNRIRRMAAEHPDRAAVSSGDTTLTYSQFDDLTNRVASALTTVPVESKRIGALLRMGLPGAASFVGCAKAGLVFTPLNWRLNPAEVADIADDAQLDALIVEAEFADSARAVAKVRPGIPIVVVGDPAAVPDARSWDDFVASGDGVDPGFGDDPATELLQLYTSGTTGRPKGVVATHHNLFNEPQNFALYEFTDDSVALDALPLFHIAGTGWMSTTLSAGLHLVLLGEMRPNLVAEAIAEHRITHAFLVPSVIGMLVEMPDLAEYDLSSLRLVAYGASPITPAQLARAMDTLGCRFVQRYGMTETMGALTALRADDHDPHGARSYLLRSAGTPLPGVDVQIRDLATGEPLPAGQTGEIVCRSRNNTPGYWRRDAENAALFTADGFLRTGDAGHIDEDGYLFVTDRVKDMIISGGENVYPIEVESVLAEHPAIAEVAVVGVPDDRWGEAVVAAVRIAPGAERPSEDELVQFTVERLASYKKPQRIHFLDELPRNASGKILKRTLRNEFAPAPEGSTS